MRLSIWSTELEYDLLVKLLGRVAQGEDEEARVAARLLKRIEASRGPKKKKKGA